MDADRTLARVMFFGVGDLFVVVGHVGGAGTAGRWVPPLLPVVEFEDAAGVSRRVPVSAGVRLMPHPVCARVRVRHARADPGRVRLPPALIDRAFPAVFTGLGLVAVALGVVIRVYDLPADGTEVHL